MGEQGIPQEIKAFIIEHIDSVVQLEILLLLHQNPQKDFTAADIGRELRIDPSWAQGQLAELSARGLLMASDGENFRYQPKSPDLDPLVAGLAQAYADRRVSVISFIFSKPVDKIRSFADAFRIRRDRSDG